MQYLRGVLRIFERSGWCLIRRWKSWTFNLEPSLLTNCVMKAIKHSSLVHHCLGRAFAIDVDQACAEIKTRRSWAGQIDYWTRVNWRRRSGHQRSVNSRSLIQEVIPLDDQRVLIRGAFIVWFCVRDNHRVDVKSNCERRGERVRGCIIEETWDPGAERLKISRSWIQQKFGEFWVWVVKVALVLAMVPNEVRATRTGGYLSPIIIDESILSHSLITKEIDKERDPKDVEVGVRVIYCIGHVICVLDVGVVNQFEMYCAMISHPSVIPTDCFDVNSLGVHGADEQQADVADDASCWIINDKWNTIGFEGYQGSSRGRVQACKGIHSRTDLALVTQRLSVGSDQCAPKTKMC